MTAPSVSPRPLSEIRLDAVTLAAALSFLDRLSYTDRNSTAEFFAIIALVAPFARKLADDLEEVL
jgi:hypothetical protein